MKENENKMIMELLANIQTAKLFFPPLTFPTTEKNNNTPSLKIIRSSKGSFVGSE